MGRKVHPIGYRLAVSHGWQGRWFAEGKQYSDQLKQDFEIRKHRERLNKKMNPLRINSSDNLDIDELYMEDEGGGACLVCHK